jgi:hypothetical protein
VGVTPATRTSTVRKIQPKDVMSGSTAEGVSVLFSNSSAIDLEKNQQQREVRTVHPVSAKEILSGKASEGFNVLFSNEKHVNLNAVPDLPKTTASVNDHRLDKKAVLSGNAAEGLEVLFGNSHVSHDHTTAESHKQSHHTEHNKMSVLSGNAKSGFGVLLGNSTMALNEHQKELKQHSK